jgi:alpha/beta superfamily hydrolase
MSLVEKKEQIFITSEQVNLDTYVLYPDCIDNAAGAVIIFHPDPLGGGTYDNKVIQIIAKAYMNKGYVAFCPNLSGVGKSAGVFNKDSTTNILNDAIIVYKHVKIYLQHVGIVDNIMLIGFSFGSHVAALLAQNVEYKKLILVAPPVTRYEIVVHDISKTIVIHSTGDEIVPIGAVYDWAKCIDISIVVFVGFSHFFHGKLLCLKNYLECYGI